MNGLPQVNFRFGIGGRLFGRASVTYEATYLEDTGGSLLREQLQHRLTIQGRYRLLRYSLRAVISDETQGTTERKYTQVTANITRDF